jgi:hypothetical protein
MSGKAYCKNCAYLVVVHGESNGRIEATRVIRETGKHTFSNHAGRPRQYVPDPVCHAGRRPAWNMAEMHDDAQHFIDQISMPLDCDSFTAFDPGRGPKEIVEMNALQTSIDLQKKFLSLQESFFDLRRQQIERQDQSEERLRALEGRRHDELVGVGKSQAQAGKWQAWANIVAVVISLVALALVVADKLNQWFPGQ